MIFSVIAVGLGTGIVGLSVIASGYVFDARDTYDPAFAAGAAFPFLTGLASFAIRERKYSVRYQPPTPLPASSSPVSAGAAASDGN